MTAPAGLSKGDVVVIWLVSDHNTWSAPTGFTTAADGTNNGYANYQYLFWRTADGTEGSTFTCGSTATANVVVLCSAWQNALGGSPPFDPGTPTASPNATGNSNSPSIAGLENSSGEATTKDGAMILWLYDGYAGTAGTLTYPAGFTGTTASQANLLTAGMGYWSQASKGTVGTKTGTAAGTPSWSVQMVAVKA